MNATVLLQMEIKRHLRALAPYFSVAIFWYVWPNAWLAVLAYHAQILFWNWPALRGMRLPVWHRNVLLAFPTVLAGPLLYFLLPIITRTDLSAWMESYHLSGTALVVLIPYFGIVHPVLEQIHWHPLRESSGWSHPMFAGYHMLVLASLLPLTWLVVCFSVLTGASFVWKLLARKSGGIAIPAVSHILADLGVIVAAWARTSY